MVSEFMRGFQEGYALGYQDGIVSGMEVEGVKFSKKGLSVQTVDRVLKPKRKVKQSKKQKLLTSMTKKKWDKYKKGRGKKTYVEIRAEVSRSQAFKKASKRL